MFWSEMRNRVVAARFPVPLMFPCSAANDWACTVRFPVRSISSPFGSSVKKLLGAVPMLAAVRVRLLAVTLSLRAVELSLASKMSPSTETATTLPFVLISDR